MERASRAGKPVPQVRKIAHLRGVAHFQCLIFALAVAKSNPLKRGLFAL